MEDWKPMTSDAHTERETRSRSRSSRDKTREKNARVSPERKGNKQYKRDYERRKIFLCELA